MLRFGFMMTQTTMEDYFRSFEGCPDVHFHRLSSELFEIYIELTDEEAFTLSFTHNVIFSKPKNGIVQMHLSMEDYYPVIVSTYKKVIKEIIAQRNA